MDQKPQASTLAVPSRQAIIQEARRIQAENDYTTATAYLMRAGIAYAEALHILLSKHQHK